VTEVGRGRDGVLRVRLLGQVRAHLGSEEIDLGSARRRTLFAMLATQAGQVVSQDQIIDGLWADSPPGNPSASIYTYVNGLRRALDPHRDPRSSASLLESVPPGYRLSADGVTVDATRFAGHLNLGRALLPSDPAAAVTEFDAALDLWHGDPLTGVNGPFVRTTRLRLLEQRFSLIEEHATAMLVLGHHDAVLGDLRELVRHYPLREHPRSLLMQALYRAGRTQEALAVFADIETVLSTELGIDPSAQLWWLRDRIAGHAPELLSGPPVRTDLIARKSPVTPDAPAQLPRQLTTFVGRETELARLRTALVPAASGPPGAPMIGVLSGPAGVGKTTVAVKIAHELTELFPDGHLFVNLRGFDPHEPAVNPAQALVTLLGDLARPPILPGQSEAELSAQFRSVLAGKRMLIVLDNALSSEQVRPLLPGSSCLVLVTSRNRLDGLVVHDGAQVIDLNPLPPDESSHFLAQLLGDGVSEESAADRGRIAELCGHLPLALGIVARRLATHPGTRLSDVVAALSDESDRLDALSSDGDAVRPAFSWSYHALKPEPAHLFRRLGLYPGDEISTGAAAALNATTVPETRKLLDLLANGNLISRSGRDRYRIHDLLHLYTKELAHSDETPQHNDAATRRLLDWYLHTTDNTFRWLEPARHVSRIPLEPVPDDCHPVEFADEESATNWVLTESANLRTVLRHAIEQGYDDYAWKTVCLVWDAHRKGPQMDEWTDLLELSVAAAERRGDKHALMWTTAKLGSCYMYLQRFDQSMECFQRSLELWSTDGADEPKTKLHQAVALVGAAHILHLRGEHEVALQYCLDALPVVRGENDTLGEIWVLSVAGTIYRVLGRLAEAEISLQKSFRLSKEQQHRQLILESFILWDLGWVEKSRGQLEEAKVILTQAWEVARSLGNPLNEIRMLHPLRDVLHDLGQVTEAELRRQQIKDLAEKYSLSEALVEALG
jgi:DNA-binding SARP family transcriptional activator/tetratricopeptide (TPR) repeat protein/Mrp family chromosome partitioning ATPase